MSAALPRKGSACGSSGAAAKGAFNPSFLFLLFDIIFVRYNIRGIFVVLFKLFLIVKEEYAKSCVKQGSQKLRIEDLPQGDVGRNR